MAFNAQVLNVLIASPVDVQEERAVVVDVIHGWNVQHSQELGVVLLPVMWETHSAPETGRPQGILNRQVVDPCDLAVAIFWHRIGSPTGKAVSGTVEEIERMDEEGRLVMLYFSSARPNLEEVEPQQLQAVRDFRARKFKTALVGTFRTLEEFREQFSRNLNQQVRQVMAGQIGANKSRPRGVDFQFEFADVDTGQAVGSKLMLATSLLRIEDFESLPDYGKSEDQPQGVLAQMAGSPNRDYYRQSAVSVMYASLFRPIRWFIRNNGTIGGRDVHVTVTFRTSEPVLIVRASDAFPPGSPPRQVNYHLGLLGGSSFPSDPKALLQPSKEWSVNLEIGAAQPTRVIPLKSELVIAALKDCTVEVVATIYADTLSEPARHDLSIEFKVRESTLKAADWAGIVDRTDQEPPVEASAT
jgi:hypothetical protein